MKILFIVIDGLADKAIEELGSKTPLEAGKTANLDCLAKQGQNGLIEPWFSLSQKYPHSDTAHLALFGYDPKKFHAGRGVYEALGANIALEKGDVCLRANFAFIDENCQVVDRRAGRIKDTGLLIKALAKIKVDKVQIIIKKSYGHRLAIVLRSKRKISDCVSSNDPRGNGLEVKPISPKTKSAAAVFTARALRQFLEQARDVLAYHPANKDRIEKGKLPANYLLVRGAGIAGKDTPSFKERYGLSAVCVAGGNLYKGVAKSLGMLLINVSGANGFVNTNLPGKISAAKKALLKHNFVYLHIKAADSLAEDGDFTAKKKFIEKIDKHIKPILGLKNTLVIVTSDHATCSELKKHCQELVPLLIWGKEKDRVKQFSERAASKGDLGKIKALDLMPKIIGI